MLEAEDVGRKPARRYGALTVDIFSSRQRARCAKDAHRPLHNHCQEREVCTWRDGETGVDWAMRSSSGRCAMIKKVKGGYKVVSETTGRNLGGPYKTLEEAKKRLRQVEFFKHRKG